jgi:NAD(P)-dependent dehydrogenase (short-subunit alcohol dehydrogenase family)
MSDIPPQHGRLAVVTGSTQGLGLVVAKALAGAGAEVIVPARSKAKGASAIQQILFNRPAGRARYELLDLTSLASVRDFAQRLIAQGRPVDLLINNAAVMAPKERRVTQDGFELQFQTNHLAPFALTAQLMPLLRMAEAPRVTQVSSIAHRDGKIDFDDLQWKTRKYNAMASYAQSKLADLMFAFELQRHSDTNGWGLRSNAAHPGLSVTDLVANSRGQDDMMVRAMKFLGSLVRQPAEDGALPILYAATLPDAKPGTYYGPKNRMETRGPVAVAKPAKQSLDVGVAKRLWKVSEELTKVPFPSA